MRIGNLLENEIWIKDLFINDLKQFFLNEVMKFSN